MAVAAEELGFDSVWLSEHHGADDAYLPSLLPILAAIAAVTNKIRLGTAILIPSLYHPIQLAESVAVVDQLSRGRVVLGLGLGWRKTEFDTFGIPFSQRAGRTAEIIGILRRLWSDDPAPFRGRYAGRAANLPCGLEGKTDPQSRGTGRRTLLQQIRAHGSQRSADIRSYQDGPRVGR
jgi:alkanesulfonate monooxygenase SsuD/methylene tetrahydromethanopterin reductase-like flavin-dependent oxidoreductase (luciferase family)